MPLCYMADFAWASTETRKIVKLEERIVHFLDDKQTVRQTDWDHLYADVCGACSVREICGGLFNRGDGYDPAELYPLFMPLEPIVETILNDPGDLQTGIEDIRVGRANGPESTAASRTVEHIRADVSLVIQTALQLIAR